MQVLRLGDEAGFDNEAREERGTECTQVHEDRVTSSNEVVGSRIERKPTVLGYMVK